MSTLFLKIIIKTYQNFLLACDFLHILPVVLAKKLLDNGLLITSTNLLNFPGTTIFFLRFNAFKDIFATSGFVVIFTKRSKEMDSFDKKETKRNAQSLRLTGINYRADKALIKEANRHCRLERGGESRLHQSPYSKEERLKLALEYISQNGAMRVMDYMELTSLSRTKATLELKEFREDASSGITTLGRGSAKVYVKSK